MKQITVVSGKGGVGKSTITASLAKMLSENNKIIAVDSDVDAPNLALVLGVKEQELLEVISTNEKAYLNEEKCLSCGKCKDVCNFDSINWNKEKNQPEFSYMKCEGCGACELVCPYNAIELKQIENAEILMGLSKYGFTVISGQLKMGESGSGKVISVLKRKAEKVAKENTEIMLVDSAAGIGCPVISSLKNSDYVLVVTEPTPAAIEDMKRVIEVIDHFDIPFGVIVNKWDINKELTKKLENDYGILTKIPYSKDFVDSLVELTPIVDYNHKYEKYFEEIINKLTFLY